MAKFLGVDTGGTFTDFILFDSETREVRIHKVLSTPQAPEQSIMQGIAELGIDGNALSVVHGSTVATNAVLEGKGVRTVYITNHGLGDVLAIGRQAREELYNLTPGGRQPLISRDLCIEVNSRLSAQGEHLQQLAEADLCELVAELGRLAPRAVAINLLFSFFDASEEIRIERRIAETFGADGIFISRSSDVLPEYREFERGMTTALNAKVGPLMQGYLDRLEKNLRGQRQHNVSLSIMQSSGGTTSAGQAGRYPVNLLLSGPAGGLKGAQTVAAASGIDRLLSFDMGGTSTDVSIIDKEIGFTTGAKIGGYPVAVPMVDMHTIGAGGGSIARLDAGGLLLVGPESAGADPGPACYGKGGNRPTVTDANVVLGRLLPANFLGGNMRLDRKAALAAVNSIARPLSITVEQAARGIIDVVNDHMVRALRVMSVERGEDPKDFTLVSFGGAGGLHVCALADALEMTKALVPVNAGVLSALGMLAADASRERSRTLNRRLQDCDKEEINQVFIELVTQAREDMSATVTGQEKAGSASNNTRISAGGELITEIDEDKVVLSVDMRYRGQSHALNLPWFGLDAMTQAFHQKHRDSYGHDLAIDIELVNLRVRVIRRCHSFVLPPWQPTESLRREFIALPGIAGKVAVLNRAGLPAGYEINGPALITETSSTTWLAPGWMATIDSSGNINCRASESAGK